MTTEQIEQAAKAFAVSSPDNDISEEDLFWEEISFKRGAEWMQEQQPYTADDMKAFAEWTCVNDYDYSSNKKVWSNGGFDEDYNLNETTTDKLLKLWRNQNDSKNKNRIGRNIM